MKLEEVYSFFGSANAAAKKLGISRQSFSMWTKRGYIPFDRQKRLEELTRGKLKASEEDAKKIEIEHNEIYLPFFRYYDVKHGMCLVKSLHFTKNMRTKIVYQSKDGTRRCSFDSVFLMQATDIKDIYDNAVYEGDIIKSNGKEYIVDSMTAKSFLKNLCPCEIIGHIYDKEKNGH